MILLGAHPRLPRAVARGGSPLPIDLFLYRHGRRGSQKEGALKSVFRGMRRRMVRCVLTTGKPGPGHRLPFIGPEPSYRTRQEEHALPIVRNPFRPAIPRRVARQHCPPPLHRRRQHNTHSRKSWGKGDISILRERGHFYFALTAYKLPLTAIFDWHIIRNTVTVHTFRGLDGVHLHNS
jgi:hypothetical protein